ncbi:uncharacterized protein LOC142227968 isoform X1 [Haematobia irritans]|uniref:uncharacterized protein LOC142227968 isoform X1 n=2 Tax=Haematobia irritans TaxID=7368 RepID=UPI003F50AC48
MMRGYFCIETLGTKICVKPLMSKEDERAINILESTVKQICGRYECSLLWKVNMALNRLYSVERKMTRDSEYKKQYCEKIGSYIAKGYCRKLSLEEKVVENGLTFYLPHFGVKHPNKNGIRLVFVSGPDMPRSQWKRGRVIELHPGKYGIARSAEVRTDVGVYRRPVSKLAMLDVENGESSPSGSIHGGGDVVEGNPS